MGILDWLTTRITLFLYLLAGNFERGFTYYKEMFFTGPENNRLLLETGGILAAQTMEAEAPSLANVQHIVGMALILELVIIAVLTLV